MMLQNPSQNSDERDSDTAKRTAGFLLVEVLPDQDTKITNQKKRLAIKTIESECKLNRKRFHHKNLIKIMRLIDKDSEHSKVSARSDYFLSSGCVLSLIAVVFEKIIRSLG